MIQIGKTISKDFRKQIGFYIGSNVNVFVPPDDLNIFGNTYKSSELDAYLIYHAFTLITTDEAMDIRGTNNPTSASLAARQELFNNANDVTYNLGFNPFV